MTPKFILFFTKQFRILRKLNRAGWFTVTITGKCGAGMQGGQDNLKQDFEFVVVEHVQSSVLEVLRLYKLLGMSYWNAIRRSMLQMTF